MTRGDELTIIDRLQHRYRPQANVPIGPGDDMAMMLAEAGRVLITADMLLDGVHFNTQRHPLIDIGRKAAACSLSDCAAMAVKPVAMTLSVAFPTSLSTDEALTVITGAADMAASFRAPLVGGDTNRWSNPLAIDVNVIAVPYESVEPVRRDGARPGDRLYVTGPLGGSAAGHHLTFTPRVHEAHGLAAALGERLHAMLDLSDGLALDLMRMCRASGVGAIVDESLLTGVFSDDALAMAREDGRSPLEHALHDGEDFELLLAAAGEVDVAGVSLFPIGEITESALQLRRSDGALVPLPEGGFVH